MLELIMPPTSLESRMKGRDWLTAGTIIMIERPRMPVSSTGRRPMRSERAPRMGAKKNCIRP
jgi:hypothetical protein